MTGVNPNTTALPATGQPAAGTTNGTSFLNAAFNKIYPVQLKSYGNSGESVSGALNDMSNILDARQQRLRDISVAIATDAASTGTFNALALQRLQLESSTNEQFSQLQKSIFDKMSSAISAWTQLR